MSKMSDMAATIEELRTAASAINDVANWLAEMFSDAGGAEPAAPAEPALTLEQVRAVLADKSRQGHTAEIRSLLQKYLKALRILGEERDEIIATFESIKDEMYDTTDTAKEQAALQEEVMVVTEMVEQCISENAHVAQNQKDYQKKYNVLSDCYDRTKERLDKVSGRIMERQAKREMIEAFLRDLAEMDEEVQEFTDDLWFNLLDHVTVFSKKDVMFTFKNGTEIRVK